MFSLYRRMFFITLFSLAFTSSAAFAASCYDRAEAEAEQGIRIHSELMVIGLNCQHMHFTDGSNLYLKYRDFTSRHSGLLSGYEDTLMEYYRRTGQGNPEMKLNTLRTSFANKVSLDAAEMKPHNFCNQYARRIFQVDNMNRQDLRKWAATLHKSHPLSERVCEQ